MAAVPSYAITQAAYLASDVVAVAASAVGVASTYASVVIQAFLQSLNNSIPLISVNTFAAPSLTAAVARFNTDWTRLKTDWNATFSAANFQNYGDGLQSAGGTAVVWQCTR